jgi:hypothetical protein
MDGDNDFRSSLQSLLYQIVVERPRLAEKALHFGRDSRFHLGSLALEIGGQVISLEQSITPGGQDLAAFRAGSSH